MHAHLDRFGAASAHELRSCRNRLPRLLRDGTLQRPFPGVYVVASRAHETEVRLRAALLAVPRGVLLGPAARAVLDPAVHVGQIDVAVPAYLPTRAGIVQHRVKVPGVFEFHGLRIPPEAWNALWSAAFDGGEGIDHFLRRRGSIALLREAAEECKGTWGADERRRILAETRAESWSIGERRLHRLLRQHGIEGWSANTRIQTAGASLIVDVAFRRQRVVIEFDGWEFHGAREAFDVDRERQAELVAAGWAVLRFTWRQVDERPEWVVRCILSALDQATRVAA